MQNSAITKFRMPPLTKPGEPCLGVRRIDTPYAV
jgi:hypothetical protein